MQKLNILRVAVVTGVLLLIPLVLQLTIGTGVDGQGFHWNPGDFVVIGIIIFIAGLAIEVIRNKAGKYRLLGMVAVVLAFLWLWAELAVGVFTNWGS